MSRRLLTGESTLGDNLRACRLGYAWADRCGAWLRLSDHADGFLLELCPPRQIHSGGARTPHRCWWEGPTAHVAEVIDLAQHIIAGSAVTRCKVRQPIAFVFDEVGTFVRWVP